MTTQQNHEQEIMNRFDPLLWKFVHSFINRCSKSTVPAEDLIQEARLAFLHHIRTHQPEEYHMCRLTILHALYDAVQRAFPVRMPRVVFIDKQRRGTFLFRDFDEEEERLIDTANDYGRIDLALQLIQEARKISPEAEDLLRLKANGYSNREAAQLLGKTDVKVCRTLKQLWNTLNVG